MPACCLNTVWNIIIVTKYFKLSPFHGYNFKLLHLKLCRNTEFLFIHDQDFSHRRHLWDYGWHRKILLQEDMNDTTLTLSLYTFKRQTYCQETQNNLLSQGSLAFGLSLHPLPQRVSVVSIHLNLTEEIKLSIVTFGKLFNLCFCPWFLNATKTTNNY